MTKPKKMNKDRMTALVELARVFSNVSKACRVLECSRDTYYKAIRKLSLDAMSRKPEIRKQRGHSHEFLKNKLERKRVVMEMMLKYPDKGKRFIAKKLQETGVFISPSVIYGIIQEKRMQDEENCPEKLKPIPIQTNYEYIRHRYK